MNNTKPAKVAILTGASGSLGRAIATQLSRAGWSIALHGRNDESLNLTHSQLESPANAITVVGEINQPEHREALVEKAMQKFGRIDALINNAGIFQTKSFLEVTEADLDQFISTNLKGTYFLTQKVLPHMLNQGGGSVLNIGSVLVDHSIADFPITAPISIKGAIHSFSRQLAAEFGRKNIRVNTLAPGIIRSAMHKANGLEDDSMAGLHLLNRIGEVEDVATLAVELISNQFISGTTVNIDGGHVAGHYLNTTN